MWIRYPSQKFENHIVSLNNEHYFSDPLLFWFRFVIKIILKVQSFKNIPSSMILQLWTFKVILKPLSEIKRVKTHYISVHCLSWQCWVPPVVVNWFSNFRLGYLMWIVVQYYKSTKSRSHYYHRRMRTRCTS